jgi:hypothetical protein
MLKRYRHRDRITGYFFTILALLIAVLCGVYEEAAHAEGDVAHVVVTLPTLYTDESPLPLADLLEVHIQWFRPNALVPSGERILTPTQLMVDIAGMKCGDFIFRGFARTTATAKYPNTGDLNPTSTSAPYATEVTCSPKAIGLTVH